MICIGYNLNDLYVIVAHNGLKKRPNHGDMFLAISTVDYYFFTMQFWLVLINGNNIENFRSCCCRNLYENSWKLLDFLGKQWRKRFLFFSSFSESCVVFCLFTRQLCVLRNLQTKNLHQIQNMTNKKIIQGHYFAFPQANLIIKKLIQLPILLWLNTDGVSGRQTKW